VTAFAELVRQAASRDRESLAMDRANDDRSNDDVAAYFAMLKAGFKRKPKASPVEYARRFALEKLSLQRRYCDAFALWRSCRRPVCRRQQSCHGDANACLKRALDRVPRDVQRRARQDIIAAMPHNIGAPEREARLCVPADFYE
jgi:hypothetical protein